MTLSRYRRRGLFVTLLVVAVLAVSGLAAAAPGAQHPADADADTDERLSPIEFEYFEDDHLLVYWLTSDEPVEGDPVVVDPVDCTAGFGDDGVAEDAVSEDVVAEDDATEVTVPEGCYVVDVAGPNGQVNHGTVMSAFVHSLKEFEFEGPRGLAVREMAHSDLGKGDQQVKPGDDADLDDADLDDDDDDAEIDDSDEKHGPPDHANANGRDKKPKKPKKNK
jgi:hypothetical protein